MSKQKNDALLPFLQQLSGGQSAGQAQSKSPAFGMASLAAFGPDGVGSGPANAPITQVQPQGSPTSKSMVGSLTADQLAAYKALGMDVTPEWKLANEGVEQKAGSYYVKPGEGMRYVPDPAKGIDFQDGKVQPMNGFLATTAGITGANKGAELAATDRFALPSAVNTSKGSFSMLPSQQRAAANGGTDPAYPQTQPKIGTNPSFPRVTPDQQAARDVERRAILKQELINNPNDVALQSEARTAGIPLQNEAQKTYSTGQAKDLSERATEIRTAGFTADSKIGKYTQLAKLYGNFEGGKLSKTAMDLAQLGNSLGLKIDKDLPNKEAAAALSNEIALTLRSPAGGAGMPGAMSDADREFLRSMTPQLGQTAEGRKLVVNAAVAIEQRNKDIATFARKYEQKHGMVDNGFYEQLSAWAEANPLFGGK